ncbi:MAG TPA: oligosaccharide flippase family protein [Bacteroidales bacterium]|jgi:O-antigen/teichoic acid export membrane protein|nr:MAG: Teichuronic acid biosynthesis protein TuaB [Bacteroidetes bacterium ADurb.Bin028]HNY44146.1 oligosaccharide flippase family protein [Bacteroidales bacterium]HOD88484.1 oligosaccharide flippase family protein [Bacteroidales bacterium]
MFRQISKIISPKSEFSKNFFILFKGTMIAQIIPMLLMPVLTRMYSPDDFGVLELFVSVTTILGSIANLRYELSIVLPDRKEDAWNIMSLGFLIAFVLSIILQILIGFFADTIAGLLNNSQIKFWLYFVPITVFLQGAYNMLSYYNTREKSYKNISSASIWRASTRTGTQIGLGFLSKTPIGLIVGQIIGYLVSIFPLMSKIKLKLFIKKTSWSNMKMQAKRYVDFPKYQMPATLANVLAVNLVSVLISMLYNVTQVGYYSLSNRILGLPSAVIGTSMQNVYYKEAHEQMKKYGHAKEVFWSTLKKLSLMAIPIIVVIFFLGEWLFALVFGEEWRIAGYYAKILIPLIMIRFVTAPLSISLSVFEKQKVALYWQIGLLVLTLLVFGIVKIFDWDMISFMILLSSVLSLYYLYFLYLLYRVVARKL